MPKLRNLRRDGGKMVVIEVEVCEECEGEEAGGRRELHLFIKERLRTQRKRFSFLLIKRSHASLASLCLSSNAHCAVLLPQKMLSLS